MWRAVFYFVQVAILVALAVWLSDNPGKVEINWLGYRVETYFGVLLLVACVVAVVIALIYHLWRGLLGAPGDFITRRQFKRREEGYRALALGMAAAAAGDREESRRLARRADSLLQDPDLTRLLSAQAATLNGDQVAARRYFDALVENDETAFLGLTGLMRQAVADGDDEALLDLAERAHKVRPDSAFVVDTLFNLQSRGALWSEAQATLFDAVRRQVKTEAQAIGHRTAIFTARAFEAEASARFDDAGALAEKALSTMPDFVPAALVRADMLGRDGKDRQAIRLLEGLWHRNPHPDLVVAYLKLWPLEAALDRLKRIQTLTAENPTVVESRLALAFAALEANLWGEARRNLTAIESDEISARACRLMARLEQDEHGDTNGAREWLDRADGASQDKAWTCGSCGAVAPEWSALCGNCGRFDTTSWKRPPRVSVLPLIASTDTILDEEPKVVEDVGDPSEMVVEEVDSPTVERQAS
jgi:HemY protein